ncbi:hypothetical protein J6590_035001 [Homalodisca vitripennis]|nr:hypothetical protein J6590_035001 [Homalodisca vitripennis]
MKYEVEFLLQQQWFDPRLRYYNQSRYPFLNAIHHHESIWLPDTYFIMHGDFKDPLIPVHFALRIYQNGSSQKSEVQASCPTFQKHERSNYSKKIVFFHNILYLKKWADTSSRKLFIATYNDRKCP